MTKKCLLMAVMTSSLHGHFMITCLLPIHSTVPPGVCNRILLWFQPVNPGGVLLHLGVCRWGSILPSNLQFFELAAQSRKYQAQSLVQNCLKHAAPARCKWAKPMNHLFQVATKNSSASLNGSPKWSQCDLKYVVFLSAFHSAAKCPAVQHVELYAVVALELFC